MTADPSPSDAAWQSWFESVWTEREDRVYRDLFVDLGGGTFAAQPAHFARFKQAPHPGWLHHGVFACPSGTDRAHWTYATSGLSNPWNLTAPGRDPSGWSGVGFELLLCTPARADWAVHVLHHLMAWQLLVATGAVQGQPLGPGQRVPLGGAIDGSTESAIHWALVERPTHLPAQFELPSGKVEWLQLVGATEDEVQFARRGDQRALVQRLQQNGVWPLTDPRRPSLL